MGNLKLGGEPVEDASDAELLDWARAFAEGHFERIHDKTLRQWIDIARAFDRSGIPMTVRQTFYSLVSAGAVEKTEQAYARVGKQLLAMRRSGAIPYRFIADATRWQRKPASYDSLEDFLTESSSLYRRNLWAGRDVRVEVWCEKDALAGVIAPITEDWDVPLMVTRGFSSETFAYSAAEAVNDLEIDTQVYYFGDHDPSGDSAAESLERKLTEWSDLITFEQIAVTEDQIRRMNLPMRPTKKSDPRSRGWDGDSVELDAIPPDQLRALVEGCITRHIDRDARDRMQLVEEGERESLKAYADGLKGSSPE